jgi:hypothetical protein
VIHNVNAPPHVCDPKNQNPASDYRYPMSVAQLVGAMAAVDLEVVDVSAVGVSKKSLMLAPLAVLPAAFALAGPSDYSKFGFLDHANSPAALFGDYLLVMGRRN